MNWQNILTWLLVGAVAGFLADLVVKGVKVGFFGWIIVGILGGFLGGWIFSFLNINLDWGIWGQILSAFVGALILLLILRLIRRK